MSAHANGTLNKVMLIGRVGADPNMRYTQSGKANTSFNVATSIKWKDAEGEKKEKTEWHRVVAWGKLAEMIGEYVKKGSHLYVEGRIQTRSYEDDDGKKKFITEIVCSDIETLQKKSDSNDGEDGNCEPPENSGNDNDSELPF